MLFRSLFHKALAVAALGLAAGGGAQAKDVYWSVGIDAAPGVAVGVGNHRPVIVQPAPVYVPPTVVYAPPPQVVYAPPPQVVYPGYYAARPVVVQGPVYRAYGGHYHGPHWRGHGGHGHGGKHWKKDRHWD